MDYAVSLDQTLSVTEGIREILKTLFEALALVVVVVFIFLQGFRATLIPLCAVPVSLIGTFVVFPLFGFSINTLSLFGLVLAIGLVVDDAIVVVEAVERHIEEGMSPRDATLQAMREVSGVVIGVALVLSAVFVPTAFLPGITGRLYQQFALTIAIPVISSAFNALSLSPALSALLLRPKKKAWGPIGWFFDRFNRVFGIATHGYVNWSRLAIRKAVLSFALLAVLAVGAGLFGSRLPSGFLPEEDQGYIYLALQLPDAASLERTGAASRKIEEILSKIPGVQYTTVWSDSVCSVSCKILIARFSSSRSSPGANGPNRKNNTPPSRRTLTNSSPGLPKVSPSRFRRRRFRAWALPADSNSFWKIAPAKTSRSWRKT